MTVSFGKGHYSYEPFSNWARLPPELELGDVAGIAVDEMTGSTCSTVGAIPSWCLVKLATYYRHGDKGSFPTRMALRSGRTNASI